MQTPSSQETHATLNTAKLPHFLNFPPSYTLQPVLATRSKQIQLWSTFLLKWCSNNKQQSFASLADFSAWKYFHNTEIKRNIDPQLIHQILEDLFNSGRVLFVPALPMKNSVFPETIPPNTTIYILYKTVAQWATLLYNYAKESGGSIFTKYDLCNGNDTTDQEFFHLDSHLFDCAVIHLESTNKAKKFGSGLKFF